MTTEINAGAYQANALDDGRIEVWNEDVHLFTLPAGFPPDQVENACRVYDIGCDRGERRGRTKAQADMRRALGL